MMDISIKNVPEEKVARLKQRARQNHRSLQGELLAMIDQALARAPRRLSVEEVAAEVEKLGLTRRNEAAALVRSDRDR
jgi:plasmid stability protein